MCLAVPFPYGLSCLFILARWKRDFFLQGFVGFPSESRCHLISEASENNFVRLRGTQITSLFHLNRPQSHCRQSFGQRVLSQKFRLRQQTPLSESLSTHHTALKKCIFSFENLAGPALKRARLGLTQKDNNMVQAAVTTLVQALVLVLSAVHTSISTSLSTNRST